MKLALVCEGESGPKACRGLAIELALLGASVTCITPATSGWDPLADIPWLPLDPLAAASSEVIQNLDAVGVFLDGGQASTFRRVHQQAAQLRGRPPVTLFTGPIRPLCGDALAADLLPRLGYDLLCLQGESQLQELAWLVRGSNQADQVCEAIGLWTLPTQPIGHSIGQQPLLLVLDSVDVPPSPYANGVLYRRLRAIALDSPGWLVRLQPDSGLPSEPDLIPQTSLAWHHRQDPAPPANLQLGRAEDLPMSLIQASACLGIGSTWLFSSMVWGKPTVVLGDYGIRTDFDGPLFFGSGAMHRLADCLPLERLLQLPPVNPQWLLGRGWGIADGPRRLLGRLEGLRR